MSKKYVHLSKSRYLAGLQCHKRLFLECFHSDLRDPISQTQEAIFSNGDRIGELALSYFPSGVMISEDYKSQELADEKTAKLVEEGSVPAIYEAGFSYDDIKVRVDVLRNNFDGSWDIVEVKSSTKAKEVHHEDVALQLFVLKSLGMNIRKTYLMTIDSSYVYQGEPHDPKKLFKLHDLSEKAEELRDNVISEIQNMRGPLLSGEMPLVTTGKQCKSPYMCPFYGHCHHNQPKTHISKLPNIRENLISKLEGEGYERIEEIDAGFNGLSSLQKRVVTSTKSNLPFIGKDLHPALQTLPYPHYYLDFETFNPSLPLYTGTSPYEQIPFQWSLHTVNRPEDHWSYNHTEFLASGAEDPRREFAHTLVNNIDRRGTVFVYSSFEKTILKKLGKSFADLEPSLDQICDDMFDLLKLIKKEFYHPDFEGSFSIKKVLPALVPELDYDSLAIGDGGTASITFALLASKALKGEKALEARENLLEYCKQDTLAMVLVHKALLAVSIEQKSPESA